MNREIRISAADKGGTIVVQNVSDFIKKNQKDSQLGYTKTYKPLQNDSTVSIAKRSNELNEDLQCKDRIDDNTYEWAKI